ncbi:MAG: flagellar filament capping protein FliD, partial [Thermoguttaceae bacterium]
EKITGYVTEEDGDGKTIVTGFKYKDAADAEQEVLFTEGEKELIAAFKSWGAYPAIKDGKIETDDATAVLAVTDPQPVITDADGNPKYAVTWKFDETDTTKVVGYSLTEYKTVNKEDFSEAETEYFNSVQPLKFPMINQNGGGFKKVDVMKTVEHASGPPEIEGITWNFETTGDGKQQLIGYTLGDGITTINFTEDEKSYFPPDSNLYPELKAEKIPIQIKGDIGLQLRVSDDKKRIEVVDKTGKFGEDIIFQDTAAGKIATMLGMSEAGAAKSLVKGESLNLQTISYNTKISDLNGGLGVNLQGVTFTIRDTSGASVPFAFDVEKPETIGDILNMINRSKLKVFAKINSTGDGIVIEEINSEAAKNDFSISESKNGVLKQLGIATGVVKKETRPASDDNKGVLSLSGSTAYTIKVEKTDTLDDIRKKINDLGAAFKATTLNDGTSKPYRLSITGSATGASGKMAIDFSGIGLDTMTMTKAQDSAVLLGDPNSASSIVVHSKSNTITGAVPGIAFTITGTSTTPINVWTENSSADIKVSLKSFVENYNNFRKYYNELTNIDIVNNTKGILSLDPTLQRLESEMSELILNKFPGLGEVKSLADIGIKLSP